MCFEIFKTVLDGHLPSCIQFPLSPCTWLVKTISPQPTQSVLLHERIDREMSLITTNKNNLAAQQSDAGGPHLHLSVTMAVYTNTHTRGRSCTCWALSQWGRSSIEMWDAAIFTFRFSVCVLGGVVWTVKSYIWLYEPLVKIKGYAHV